MDAATAPATTHRPWCTCPTDAVECTIIAATTTVRSSDVSHLANAYAAALADGNQDLADSILQIIHTN